MQFFFFFCHCARVTTPFNSVQWPSLLSWCHIACSVSWVPASVRPGGCTKEICLGREVNHILFFLTLKSTLNYCPLANRVYSNHLIGCFVCLFVFLALYIGKRLPSGFNVLLSNHSDRRPHERSSNQS